MSAGSVVTAQENVQKTMQENVAEASCFTGICSGGVRCLWSQGSAHSGRKAVASAGTCADLVSGTE